MEKILFKENQKDKKLWQALLTAGVYVIVIYLLFYEEDLQSLKGYLISFISFLVLQYFIFSYSLKTLIYNDYIKVSLFPIMFGKKIYFKDLESWELRMYNPSREYGGWGYSKGILKNGLSYSIKGDTGLQLVLKDNKRVLIGTQKSEELKQVLSNHFSNLIKE